VLDSKPDWILQDCWAVLLHMRSQPPPRVSDKGTDKTLLAVEKLLTDASLQPVWESLNKTVQSVAPRFQNDAASSLIGIICNPLKLYGATGTSGRPTPKITIQQNYAKAQSHLQTASKHLMRAIEEIREATQISSTLPDETRTLSGTVAQIFEKHGHDDIVNRLSSAFWIAADFETAVFLEKLAAGLMPDLDPWAGVPGMQSNKASWRDWLREVMANLEDASRMYDVEFNLREADWVRLVNCLIDPDISRSSINAALRTANVQVRM
jgi:hypothetical protein